MSTPELQAPEPVRELVPTKVDMSISTDASIGEDTITTAAVTQEIGIQTDVSNQAWVQMHTIAANEKIAAIESVLEEDLQAIIASEISRSQNADEVITEMKRDIKNWHQVRDNLNKLIGSVSHLPELIAHHEQENVRLGNLAKDMADALQRVEREHDIFVKQTDEKYYNYEMMLEAQVRTAIAKVAELEKELAMVTGESDQALNVSIKLILFLSFFLFFSVRRQYRF